MIACHHLRSDASKRNFIRQSFSILLISRVTDRQTRKC